MTLQDGLDVEDVIKHIPTDKYTKQQTLSVMAYLENNNQELMNELIKKHHPEYYNEDGFLTDGKMKVKTFSLIKDFGWNINAPEPKFD